jgi:hypothetical protein
MEGILQRLTLGGLDNWDKADKEGQVIEEPQRSSAAGSVINFLHLYR